MILSDKQIDFIDQSLSFYGIESKSLKEDVTDHICTYIESREGHFDDLYKEAINEFGGYVAIKNIQNETRQQLYTEKYLKLKQLVSIFGYLVVGFFIISYLFKIMQWPYSNILLTITLSLLVLGFCPLLLYFNYKKSIYKFS